MSAAMNVVVLTGAGISQESGIPTFRGPDGLWEGRRVEEVASPEGFAADPELVHAFYNARRRQLLSPSVQPNAAHRALAEFERRWTRGTFSLVTQNVDDLHVRAGSRNVIAMHGELLKARCLDSGKLFDCREDLSSDSPHPLDPGRRGRLRPHIVWFGEIPLEMHRIEQALYHCDLFVAIGSSGRVYPAAGLVLLTPPQCHKVEINLEATPVGSIFDEVIQGPASREVPNFFDRLLSSATATAKPQA
jgi:NAD-dependent deacetylase